ncbi:hypothetical protein D3C71_2194950 [compost metagenome]
MFSAITFTGVWYCLAVDSSWMFIWIEPSPVMQATCAFGLASCAPMAAGRPKPMVPKPPEFSHCFGRLNG